MPLESNSEHKEKMEQKIFKKSQKTESAHKGSTVHPKNRKILEE